MSTNLTRNNIQAFATKVKRVAVQHNFRIGPLYDGSFDEPGTILNDARLTTVIRSAKEEKKLRDRFLYRFAAFVASTSAQNTPMITMMKENTKNNTVNINIVGIDAATPNLSSELQDFISTLERALEVLSQQQIGESILNISLLKLILRDDGCAQAEHLWNSMLECFHIRCRGHLNSIRKIFNENILVFDEVVATMIGIFAKEEEEFVIDIEIGDLIIAIRENIGPLNDQYLDTGAEEKVMHLSAELCQKIYIQDRLRGLLKMSSLSDALYKNICGLAIPKLAFDTFVRVARSSPNFAKVKIHLGLPSLTRSIVSTTTVQNMNQQRESTEIDAKSQASNGTPAEVIETGKVTCPVGQDPELIARCSLQPSDRFLSIDQLHPPAKQWAFRLLYTILNRQYPLSTDKNYFTFGFVGCRNKEEVNTLAELYRAILDNVERVDVFRRMWQAVEKNTLGAFFLEEGCADNLVRHLRNVHSYLCSHPSRRPSVWQLITFLHENTTEPPGILRRDYGFQFCRMREEVLRLKVIYEQILKVADPLDLHSACTQGRLYEFGICKGVSIKPNDRRLMQNFKGHADLGFGDGPAVKGFDGTHFKTSKR